MKLKKKFNRNFKIYFTKCFHISCRSQKLDHFNMKHINNQEPCPLQFLRNTF